MGKKKKDFKKFSNKKTDELKEFLGDKPNDSGVLFLLKRKGHGASFVYGSPRTIHEILYETSMQDPSFKQIILNVASEVRDRGAVAGLRRSISESDKVNGIDLSQLDIENMSDKDLDEYFKGISDSKIGFGPKDEDE